MINKKIVEIVNITIDELVSAIVKKVLDELEIRNGSLQQKKNQESLLTRAETANYLHIKLTALYNWTKKGKLKAYGIGNRVYYKKHEVDEALIRVN